MRWWLQSGVHAMFGGLHSASSLGNPGLPSRCYMMVSSDRLLWQQHWATWGERQRVRCDRRKRAASCCFAWTGKGTQRNSGAWRRWRSWSRAPWCGGTRTDPWGKLGHVWSLVVLFRCLTKLCHEQPHTSWVSLRLIVEVVAPQECKE